MDETAEQQALRERLERIKMFLGVDPSKQLSPLDVATAAGRSIDSVTGAPTRAAMGALQEGENPVTAFGQQFAENPDAAPTGEDIVAKSGMLRRGSFAEKVAGFGADVALDPTNLIPGKAAAGGLLAIGGLKKLGGLDNALSLGALEARKARATANTVEALPKPDRFLKTEKAFLKDYSNDETIDRARKSIKDAIEFGEQKLKDKTIPAATRDTISSRLKELKAEAQKFTPEAVQDAKRRLEELDVKIGQEARSNQ